MKISSRKRISVGGVSIGSGAPVSVQSMTKTDTKDVEATMGQIRRLEESGCEMVRVAIPDKNSLPAFSKIVSMASIPVIADIHFNYRLAIGAIEAGAHCLRINPGNIGDHTRVKAIVDAAKANGIPIRIGVNAGSLEKDLLEKYGGPDPKGLYESALRHIRYIEEMGFDNIKVSLKASSVISTIQAYRLFAATCDYPLHVGITEAGTMFSGTVKSAVGIGILLNEGIGDTIRVSLTGPPEEEVKVGFEILRSLGLRERGPEIISCPTCGRVEVDIEKIVHKVEEKIRPIKKNIKVAIMGCAVNGPGEASEADVGVACGRGVGLIFLRGEIVKKVREEEIIPELMNVIETLAIEDKGGS